MDEKKYIERLGQHIKELRKKKGISQIDLAYDCDFEKQNMRRIEAGKTNPTIKTLLKIAKALNISISELVKNFDEK